MKRNFVTWMVGIGLFSMSSGCLWAPELDRVRTEIRNARQDRDDARLPGLLAWEARIESAPEWPIDASALRLSGLYVLIPDAS